MPGSPAIDGGVNLNIPLDPSTNVTFTTDQRGFTRISNGTVDIGAVETSALSVTSLADDDSAGTLRAKINAATALRATRRWAVHLPTTSAALPSPTARPTSARTRLVT